MCNRLAGLMRKSSCGYLSVKAQLLDVVVVPASTPGDGGSAKQAVEAALHAAAAKDFEHPALAAPGSFQRPPRSLAPPTPSSGSVDARTPTLSRFTAIPPPAQYGHTIGSDEALIH